MAVMPRPTKGCGRVDVSDCAQAASLDDAVAPVVTLRTRILRQRYISRPYHDYSCVQKDIILLVIEGILTPQARTPFGPRQATSGLGSKGMETPRRPEGARVLLSGLLGALVASSGSAGHGRGGVDGVRGRSACAVDRAAGEHRHLVGLEDRPAAQRGAGGDLRHHARRHPPLGRDAACRRSCAWRPTSRSPRSTASSYAISARGFNSTAGQQAAGADRRAQRLHAALLRRVLGHAGRPARGHRAHRGDQRPRRARSGAPTPSTA